MRDFAPSDDGEAHSDPAPPPVLASIRAYGVAVDEPGEVGGYLGAHPELGHVVERLSRAARERLGPRTWLTLELVRDPELDDEQLTLYARQVEYDPDLLERLDEVNEQQEGEAAPSAGRVILTTDFQPPR